MLFFGVRAGGRVVFCCSGGGVFYFLLFGQGRGPRPNSKK